MKPGQIKPINIVKITVEYENGTLIVVNEAKTPKIGKIFFDTVLKDPDIQWQVIEPKEQVEPLHKKVKKFFEL